LPQRVARESFLTHHHLPNQDYFCRDGLRGRASGEWARTKLKFLDDYLPPAIAVTHKFRRRWYLDLFAGPGCNIDRDRNYAEFDGSPLRALTYYMPRRPEIALTDAVLVNKDAEDHRALEVRVDRVCTAGESRIVRNRIRIRNDDTNLILPEIMSQIPARDYVFAFADITGIAHWPFASVEELRRNHSSIDFYMLFPLEMTLIRKLSYREEMTARYENDLTSFFGGQDWTVHHRQRQTPADTDQLKRDITELYLQKLRTLWSYAEVQHTISMADNRPLYRMIFASNHPIASELAKWQKGNSQAELF
jgi:three-Cys-motif partner protein